MSTVITDAQSKAIISDNLRQALADAGMSQGDLAREMQLPGTSLQSWRQRICRWCNGETLPTAADRKSVV
jgi:transcriptional regulator with XRE-family HTH domain